MAEPKRKTAVTSVESAAPATSPWQRPAGLTRRGWAILGACLVLINLPVLHYFLLRGQPPVKVSLPFSDDFAPGTDLAEHYWTNGGGLWRVVHGELFSPGVKNNPLWLLAKLPQDVRVEFDARAASPDGDIRAEIFGNGTDHLSGYLLVYGGWGNARAALVRGWDENGPTLAQLQADAEQRARQLQLPHAGLVETGVYKSDTNVRLETAAHAELGRTYHFVIERRGSRLRVTVDRQVLFDFDDPFPLTGSSHDRFGLSSAEGDVAYDNLRVEPLAPGGFAEGAPTPSPAAPELAPGPFSDDFQRDTPGLDWNATDAASVRLDHGSMVIVQNRNHPVWLRRPIPDPVSIEFDAWTDSTGGDLKVEVFGDGVSYHTGELHAAYTATGYVLILGGWNNTESVIARQEEHAPNRIERDDFRVQPGHHYHWRITRQGNRLSWYVDGQPFLQLDDPEPLRGPGHDHFAFSGWESPVHFANLKIEPLR